jgi:glycosyltransferase involved in cell wall biosynthesis
LEKQKVLHVIKGLGRGGAERLLVETVPAHTKEFKFDIVYFLPWKNQLVQELEMLGCRVYLLPARYTITMLLQIPALLRLIRREKYGLVHCHLPWAGIVGRWAGRLSGTPVVYTEHNNFFTYSRPTRFLHRIGMRWFAYLITVSQDAQHALQTALPVLPPIRTILNGVNTRKFARTAFAGTAVRAQLGLAPQGYVVVSVAVFRPQKRLDRWLDVAAAATALDPHISFVLIGDGLERDALTRKIQELRLTERVRMPGLLTDPRPYLACADAYLMTSDYEGLPVALLEAMSMECVPVVTPVGGIPDVITDRQNGVLIDAEESEAAANKLLAMLQDTTYSKMLRMAARETVRTHYSIERMVSELEQLYQAVIQTRNHGNQIH